MKNITFVYPDAEHLGIAYLMTLLKSEGFQTNYINYRSNGMFLYKKPTVEVDSVVRQIIALKTEVAAFSCVTDIFKTQLAVAEALKRRAPEIITVFGGIHPTAVPEKVLSYKAVDCIALGESERHICEFLNGIVTTNGNAELPEFPVKGFVFKRNSEQIGSFELPDFPDLDAIGFPDKEPFFNSMPYASQEYMVLTSRGCPYSCTYCFNSSNHFKDKKRYLRRRSVDNVISELIRAKEKFSIRQVLFVDDCFTSDMDWLLDFSRKYKAKVNLPFSCLTHPLFVTAQMAKALKHAGCIYIELGIQSLSPEICRNIINRKGDKTHVIKAMQCLKDHHIICYVDHLLGLPRDTLKNQEESILFYNEHRPAKINAFWLVYFPGTTIVDKAHAMGVLTDDDRKTINGGNRLVEDRFFSIDGDYKNPEIFYGIAFVLNWLPLFPKNLVRWLIRTGAYKKLKISNYFLCVAIPNAILALLPRNYRARHLVVRWCRETLSRITKKFKRINFE